MTPGTISVLIDAAVLDFWNGMFSPSHEAGLILDKLRYYLRDRQISCSKLLARVRCPSGGLEIEVTSHGVVISRSYPPPGQSEDGDDEKTVVNVALPGVWDKNHTI